MSVTSDLVCAALDECDRIDEGHTAWMLVATGFVLLCVPSKLHPRVRTWHANPDRAECPRSMTPGLAFFEAGLLRSRNSISILMQCWAGLCILSTLW